MLCRIMLALALLAFQAHAADFGAAILDLDGKPIVEGQSEIRRVSQRSSPALSPYRAADST